METHTIDGKQELICKGTWTRQSECSKSVLDYMLVAPILLPAITNMAIDDDREHPISSDHNWIFAKVKANYHTVQWPDKTGEDH
jgi:hypothetical protein